MKLKTLLVALVATFPSLSPLEAQQDTIPAEDLRDPKRVLTGNELEDDSFPGSWPMFGTGFRLKVGGHVKTDLLYDFDGTLDRRQLLMSTIPVEGQPEADKSGYLSFFSAESRINIDARRVAEGRGPLGFFIEGDFWPTGSTFRLRHAYVSVGDFVVGQTWTTLSVMESITILVDFGAGDALFGGRAAQIRYQKSVNDAWKFAVGLESLDFLGIDNPLGQAGEPSAALPLLAGRVDYRWGSGLVAVGTGVAQLRWDGGGTGPDARALQWDAVVGGRQYLGDDFVTWNISYGRGSGENIMAFAGSGANAVLTADGRLEQMPAFALLLGFAHHWNDALVSNFSYAYGWLDTPESRDPLALEKGGIWHANLIWQATREFSAGIEYMEGRKRATNEALGTGRRIQTMVKLAL